MPAVHEINDLTTTGSPKWGEEGIQVYRGDTEAYIGGHTTPYKDILKRHGAKWVNVTYRYSIDLESVEDLLAELISLPEYKEPTESGIHSVASIKALTDGLRIRKDAVSAIQPCGGNLNDLMGKIVRRVMSESRKTIMLRDVEAVIANQGPSMWREFLSGLTDGDTISVRWLKEFLARENIYVD